MALVKLKPTSPGRRHAVKVVNKELHKGKPWAALVEKKNRGCGRNNDGHITCRHKAVVPSVPIASSTSSVIRTVSPPALNALNTIRTVPPILLSCFTPTANVVTSLPRSMTVGQEIFNGPESPIKAGNTLPLRNIPVGSTIHCIELLPGKGVSSFVLPVRSVS